MVQCCVGDHPIAGMAHRIHLHGREFILCDWDARRIQDTLDGLRSAHMVNIFWGFGHLNWSCWYGIRDFLRARGIKEVLEFGIGLSSELFVNEGLKVIGFDTAEPHVRQYQDLLSLKNDAVFHHYPDGADGPPVEQLYPGRTWELVFVDGPQSRAREVHAAMRVARRFIYLHDPNMGEEGFFPNYDWIGHGTEPKLFERKEPLRA